MTDPLHQILDRAAFSPRTKESYGRVIDQWLTFAGHDPVNWTRLKAQQFYDEMITRGVSAASANVYIASLRYVSKWYATQLNRPELDFAIVQQAGTSRYVDNGDHKPKTQRALTEDEVRRLLTACKGPTPIDHRDLALILTGLETGMRRMSLAGCRVEGLSTPNGYPVIDVPIKGAGMKLFSVPLSSTAMKVVAPWRTWLRKHDLPKGALFTGFAKRIGPKGQNVYTPTGTISLPAIYKIIEGRAEIAKIKDMHPHLLRHTFITWREQFGLSAVQIASITGHKTFGAEWSNMRGYIDMSVVAEQARESTPPWLVKLVDELVKP